VHELRLSGIDHGDRGELLVFVDGTDLLRGFDAEGGDPDDLLPVLGAADDPTRVELGHCGCGDPTCGSISMVVRADGEQVVWGDWETTLGFDLPPELSFDRVAYGAELARADDERGWESAERRFARAVERVIDDDARAALEWRGLRYQDTTPAGDGAVAVAFRAEVGGGRWLIYALFAVGDDPMAVHRTLVRRGPTSWPAVAWWGENEAAAYVQPPMAGKRWRMWQPA
jgi:hypothetical protein